MIFKKSKTYKISDMQKSVARDFSNNSAGINQEAKKDLKELMRFAISKSAPSNHDDSPLDSSNKEYSHMVSNLTWLRDCECLTTENAVNDINDIIASLKEDEQHKHSSILNIYDFLDKYWNDVGMKTQTYRILYDLVMMSQWEPLLLDESADNELNKIRKKYGINDNV